MGGLEAGVPEPPRSLEKRWREQPADLFATIIDSLHDAVIVTSADGVVLQWNVAAERIYGYSREEALGQSVVMLYRPETLSVFGEIIDRALRSGHAEVDGLVYRKDGSPVFVAGTVSAVRHESSDAPVLVGISRDVSEAKQLLDRLQEGEERLVEAQRVAAMGSWAWDLTSNEISWSAEMYRLFGLKREEVEVSFENYLSRVHPDDQALVQQNVALAFERSNSFDFDHRIVRPDGQPVWIRAVGRLGRRNDGAPTSLVGVALDVTASKQAAEELRQQRDRLAQLAAAVESTSDVIVSCTLDGTIVEWNRGAERLYGYTRAEAVGRQFATFLPPEDRAGFERTAQLVREQGRATVERVIVRKDGSTVEVETSLSLVHGEAGETVVGISREVTERNRLQRELVAHVRRLDEAQRLAAVGSWEWDLATGREVWSAEFRRMLGVEQGVEASYPLFLDRLHPQDRPRVQEKIEAHFSTPDRPLEYETRIVRPDGQLRWVAVRGEIETDSAGVPVRKAGTVQDITERKAGEAELERLAAIDTLTGLPNRDRFTAVLQAALDTADGERPVGLLLLDLDGFKDVNDGIGHHAGDLVLQEVARRISAVLRTGDEVARLGGDEFAIVLPGIGDVENAIRVAASVRSCLERPFDLDGITVHVGGSIGITVSVDRSHPGTLLKQSDVAMYRAKTLSSGWAVFEPEQDDVAATRLQMVTDLRATIERGELDVAYQPIVETRSRRVSSFEALARWHHPNKGLIPPDQFIPLAEQADLIVPLTQLVLRKAVAACAVWRRAGHDVRVGVNLAVQVMETGDVCAMVTEALSEAGIDAQYLALEITESSLATDSDEINDLLRALRELGVILVIDDFGTGYSAMSYLKQLPVKVLKIDRSFVRDIANDHRDLAIVRSLIRLAHSLELCVVAEGVETIPALEALETLGCDLAQGYGIARPMPQSDTGEWLAQYGAQSRARIGRDDPRDLLIVDDSAVVRAHLTALAEEAGWQVREAVSAEEALIEVERSIPDVVILDHHMTGMTGMQCVPELRARGVDGPVLLFTQFLSEAIPSIRVPLDVWPVSKQNPDAVLQLLDGYRTSARNADTRQG